MLFDDISAVPVGFAGTSTPNALAVGEESTGHIARSAGIDWITIGGYITDDQYSTVLDILQKYAGPMDDKVKGGGGTYFTCRRFLEGAFVSRSLRIDCPRASDHTNVTLPGTFLAKVREDGGLIRIGKLVCELAAAGVSKCTRIDVAVDHRSLYGAPIMLIDQVSAAMRSGDHFGKARACREVDDRVGDVQRGRTVYIGKRGSNGSGQYVRVYDKGLESGDAPASQWVRWEVEFCKEGERSQQALQVFLDVVRQAQCMESIKAGGDPQAYIEGKLIELAYGVIDFRTKFYDSDGTPDHKHAELRPRLDWWADLLDGIGVVRLRFVYKSADLESKIRWLQTTAFRVLQEFARVSRRDVMHVLDQLGFRESSPSYSFETRRAAREFARFDPAEYFSPHLT